MLSTEIQHRASMDAWNVFLPSVRAASITIHTWCLFPDEEANQHSDCACVDVQ